VREQSATAQGLSFAGAASGSGGVSSMFWNPATITMRPGWQSEFHLSGINTDSEITPLTGTSPVLLLGSPSGDIGPDAIVPASYTSYQLNERLWLGLGSSAPFGLVTDPDENWAGRIYSRSSRIFSLNVNAVAAVKVTDWLSVAAGPMAQYFDVRLKRAVPTALTPAGITAPNLPTGILEGDDVGVGFTAGVNITPYAGTAVGIGFRSSVHHDLEGTLTAPGSPVIPIDVSLNTPEQVTVGISQAITPVLTAHAGFEWTNWSRLKEPAIVGPTGPVPNSESLPLNYDDGFFYSFGLDYRVTDRITLRAGAAYEQSPIDTEIRSTRLPDNDRIWASLGASYQWSDQLQLDVSYTHIFIRDTAIAIVPGHQDFAGLPFVAEADSSVNIISAALKYRWDAPERPIPAVPTSPIVRKY
jgi:long-chain fatty acid transport protein